MFYNKAYLENSELLSLIDRTVISYESQSVKILLSDNHNYHVVISKKDETLRFCLKYSTIEIYTAITSLDIDVNMIDAIKYQFIKRLKEHETEISVSMKTLLM